MTRTSEIRSGFTHLCLLTGLHSLHEHHVLLASFSLLAEHSHIQFVVHSQFKEKGAHMFNKQYKPMTCTVEEKTQNTICHNHQTIKMLHIALQLKWENMEHFNQNGTQ